MSEVILPNPALAEAEAKRPRRDKRTLPLVGEYLREQHDLSAVERFSQLHEAGELPLQAKYYKRLIPLERPGPGQQYAFEVDLDRCTGCKACVSACHRMNGLEPGETWRFVGMLHGGTREAPVQKTVTSACHHCLDPACLKGCPVAAYDKDPVTGIVKHLDDQCIGCQYCVFTCPYEVPQLSFEKGIVRKCDMCSDRLAEGEAPACVQACPNEAIRIQLVDTDQVVEDAQSETFLPGAPSPAITLPTTTYKVSEALPRNALPADFYAVRPAHQHMPLVVMLVLTQLSIGAFCVDGLLPAVVPPATLAPLRPFHGSVALGLGILALLASVVHLGRPQYAWRAFLGLRTSWMSREILALGGFAKLAALYAGALWQAGRASILPGWPLQALAREWAPLLGILVTGAGLVGVYCSVMVYAVTRRLWWSTPRTSFKFFGTACVLGLATTMATGLGGIALGSAPLSEPLAGVVRRGAWALALVTLVKLAGEASVLWHLRDRRQGDLKRSALLIKGELGRLALARVGLGLLGGVLVPLVALTDLSGARLGGAVVASLIALVLLIAGELMERMSFFAAVASPRMPGGLR